MNDRIYKYDNVKAFLIFLVVLGHMTTDHVADSYLLRWTTLWIYTFHMPAFVLVSGLLHKRYKEGDVLRWDKVIGFFVCGYLLKLFLQFSRTLMGQHPIWHWIAEPGIPWYLFVMAEYEVLFFVLRKFDKNPKIIIGASFILSVFVGYFPFINDTFCLSRMISFLPFFAIGYYLDAETVVEKLERRSCKIAGWFAVAASLLACRFGGWEFYGWRKWFTGRRSYEFLSSSFPYAYANGWWIKILVLCFALVLSLSIIAIIPSGKLKGISSVGASSLNVYFYHRPVCYLFRNLYLWEALNSMHHSDVLVFLAYISIAMMMTFIFSRKAFAHPCSDILKICRRLLNPYQVLRQNSRSPEN